MCNLLNDNGRMICSVPIMENYNIPLYGIFFEHTYFLDKNVMEYFANINKMKIEEQKIYKNHSYFYCITKSENIEKITIPKFNFNKKLEIKDKIDIINNFINNNNKTVYIASSSFVSQYMICNGINKNRISGILDNDIFKQGKQLYGLNLDILSPEILKEKENIIIIFFDMPYTNEMMRQFYDINTNIIILKI